MKIEVDLNKLKWDTIIHLAYDLGCNLDYPIMSINKYNKDIMNNPEDAEIKALWEAEQEKISKSFNVAYDQFEEDLMCWFETTYGLKE